MSNIGNKILFFTFYGYRAHIKSIKEEFEKKLYIVEDIPYMILKNEEKKSESDISQIIIDKINDSYKTNDVIRSIFLFLLPADDNFIKSISENINNKITKIIFYNFDDPKSVNSDLIKYSKYIDFFFTPNILTANKLKPILKVKQTIHQPMFLTDVASNSTNIIVKNEQNLTNDLCILYDSDFDKVYESKELIKSIKLITLSKNMSIKLLGKPLLETIYPDIYDGEYNLENLKECTNDSKVILYLKSNMYSRESTDMILVKLMLGGNIIITPYNENMSYLIKQDYNCMLFNDPLEIPEMIYSITYNYAKYKSMGKNSQKYIFNNCSLSKWVDKLLSTIGHDI
jgi:hypothetical protein